MKTVFEKAETWRRKVLKKCGYKCSCCGSEKKLHCHHIKPRKTHPELKYDVNNGIVLCAGCHMKEGMMNGEIDGSKTQFKKGIKPQVSFERGHLPWNLGKKATTEARNKMRLARLGKPPSNKGIPKSEETKRKISEANRKTEDPNELRKCRICAICEELDYIP